MGKKKILWSSLTGLTCL